MEIFSLLGDFEMENDSSASMEAMMGFSGFGECLIALLHVDHLESCWHGQSQNWDTFKKYFILYLTQCYASQYYRIFKVK